MSPVPSSVTVSSVRGLGLTVYLEPVVPAAAPVVVQAGAGLPEPRTKLRVCSAASHMAVKVMFSSMIQSLVPATPKTLRS